MLLKMAGFATSPASFLMGAIPTGVSHEMEIVSGRLLEPLLIAMAIVTGFPR